MANPRLRCSELDFDSYLSVVQLQYYFVSNLRIFYKISNHIDSDFGINTYNFPCPYIGINSTQICGLAKIKCYSDVEQKVSRRNAVGNLKCHCLPACSSVSYDAELSFAKYELRKYYKAKRITYVDRSLFCSNQLIIIKLKFILYCRRQYARIFISFKDNQFFASRRSELYGRADFLANCGGLLGLFMGFSLLSLIEMIYYCTLRLACNLKKRQRRKKLRMEQINSSMEHERF